MSQKIVQSEYSDGKTALISIYKEQSVVKMKIDPEHILLATMYWLKMLSRPLLALWFQGFPDRKIITLKYFPSTVLSTFVRPQQMGRQEQAGK